MLIYIGSDHRGFQLKENLKGFLKDLGYEVSDLGAKEFIQDDDYPDYAKEVAHKVNLDPTLSRGIVICGSGVGADIVANRFQRVRCALATTPDQAMASRNDDDTNVLALAADFTDWETAKKIVSVWLQTPFSNDPRHKRRIEKINQLQNM